MVGKKLLLVSLISFTSLLFCFSNAAPDEETNLQTYLVFLEKPEGLNSLEQSEDLDRYYQQFLPMSTAAMSDEDLPRMVHSYHHVVTGFAARLTSVEVESMKEKQGFLSARRERILRLQTTYSPRFLGLQQNSGFWNASGYGKGVVIGVLDTGVTPNHPSFSDEGMPPPPAKWKGKCELEGVCNNKVIGARNLVAKGESPVDVDGHGTHTASTAAGSAVSGANALGQGFGTAVGMAPMAHLAIYKVCGEKGCTESAIMAAYDAAVEDGVDVLSISLGGDSAPFFDDGIAIGAFGAIKKGVFVSCAAGNDGPATRTLSNEAPWILTVGASTVDRQIKSTVLLGNRKHFDGQTLFQPKDFASKMLPLVYAGSSDNNSSAVYCAPGSLAKLDVKHKVVVCESGGKIKRIDKGIEVRNNGGFAMILVNSVASGSTTLADAHELPASHVSYEAGMSIKAYINSTSSPTATIVFKGTVFGSENSPQVASFSSRGPSKASPGIMKPDLIGPGVSTLAAWPTVLEENSIISSSSKPTFNMISGTSMSCPHLSGIAALLRSSHPDWSPAAIKSAMMTTTHLTQINNKPISDEQGLAADIFDMGSGHVNPAGANDPGLVYDIHPDDYIPYLCGLGYNDVQVTTIVQKKVQCSLNNQSISEAQLNYPSFVLELGYGSQPQTYTRTVTNVGKANSVYRVEVHTAGEAVDVEVIPGEIGFSRLNEKATYAVTFSMKKNATSAKFVQGSLIWVADGYSVRSPFGIMLK
ncbi:Subtilisin-like protease 3 [Linum perenne]